MLFSGNLSRINVLLRELLHILEDHISQLFVQSDTVMCVLVKTESSGRIRGKALEISIACAAFTTNSAGYFTAIGRF